MEIYWYLFGAILLLFLFEKKISNNKLLKILVVSILAVILAIRYQVGNDYIPYQQTFNALKGFHEKFYYEPLYLFICKLSPSFGYIIAFVAVTSMILLYKIIEYYNPNYFYSSLLVYFGVYFVLNDIHLIRQGFAILIVGYALRFLENDNIKKYILLIIIAMGFHTSAVIAFIPLLFLKIKWDKQKRFGFVFVGFLCYIALLLLRSSFFAFISNIGAFARYAAVYDNSNFSHSYGISFGLLFDIFVFVFVNLRSAKNDSRTEFLLNIFTIAIFIYIAFNDFAVVLRFGYYFRIVNIILIVELRKALKPRILYIALISLYSYFYLYQSLTAGRSIVDYHTIFEPNAHFNEY